MISAFLPSLPSSGANVFSKFQSPSDTLPSSLTQRRWNFPLKKKPPRSIHMTMNGTRRPRPRLVEKDVVYNVAFGSNMDGAKLRARTMGVGGANTRIEPLSEGVACRVENWELSFQYIVLPPLEPVMAGAVSKKGAALHGVLWKLTREDYEALAESEGCFWEDPIYEEREVLAVPYGRGGGNREDKAGGIRAIVFALRRPDAVPAHLHPSERYKRMMVKGARGAKLSPEYVDYLEKLRTAPPVDPVVLGVSLLTATALIGGWKSKRFAPLIRGYYTPLLANIYSVREEQFRCGRPFLARATNAAMLAVMSPVANLGFIRFVYLGADINKIASGK